MKKKLFAFIILLSFIVPAVIYLSGCSGKVQDKQFSYGKLSVVLTSEFNEQSPTAGIDYMVASNKAIFIVSTESRQDFEGAGIDFDGTTCTEYADMVKENNGLALVSDLEEDDFVVFQYWKTVSGENFYYKAYVFKFDDKFWLCQFACKNSDNDSKGKFLSWARTIQFNAEY